MSSLQVDPAALEAAKDLIAHMTTLRPEVLPAIAEHGIRFGVIGSKEQVTDMPEYSDLGDSWNQRSRGLGATVRRPLVSAGEENLLGLVGDRYEGESILIHEFSHTFLQFGLAALVTNFQDRLESAYVESMAAGLWKDTYAATNADEYWAEGAQSWFDANRSASPPNGIHNDVDTREELKAYDPALAALLNEAFGDGDWRYTYPGT